MQKLLQDKDLIADAYIVIRANVQYVSIEFLYRPGSPWGIRSRHTSGYRLLHQRNPFVHTQAPPFSLARKRVQKLDSAPITVPGIYSGTADTPLAERATP